VGTNEDREVDEQFGVLAEDEGAFRTLVEEAGTYS
jgi:hypothetical protein